MAGESFAQNVGIEGHAQPLSRTASSLGLVAVSKLDEKCVEQGRNGTAIA
jgi:hypothetical protein